MVCIATKANNRLATGPSEEDTRIRPKVSTIDVNLNSSTNFREAIVKLRY